MVGSSSLSGCAGTAPVIGSICCPIFAMREMSFALSLVLDEDCIQSKRNHMTFVYFTSACRQFRFGLQVITGRKFSAACACVCACVCVCV